MDFTHHEEDDDNPLFSFSSIEQQENFYGGDDDFVSNLLEEKMKLRDSIEIISKYKTKQQNLEELHKVYLEMENNFEKIADRLNLLHKDNDAFKDLHARLGTMRKHLDQCWEVLDLVNQQQIQDEETLFLFQSITELLSSLNKNLQEIQLNMNYIEYKLTTSLVRPSSPSKKQSFA